MTGTLPQHRRAIRSCRIRRPMYEPSPTTTCDDVLFDAPPAPRSRTWVAGGVVAGLAGALLGALLFGAVGGGLTAYVVTSRAPGDAPFGAALTP